MGLSWKEGDDKGNRQGLDSVQDGRNSFKGEWLNKVFEYTIDSDRLQLLMETAFCLAIALFWHSLNMSWSVFRRDTSGELSGECGCQRCLVI